MRRQPSKDPSLPWDGALSMLLRQPLAWLALVCRPHPQCGWLVVHDVVPGPFECSDGGIYTAVLRRLDGKA